MAELRQASLGLLVFIYTCWLVVSFIQYQTFFAPYVVLHFLLPIMLVLSGVLSFKLLGRCAQTTVATLLLGFSAAACGCSGYMSHIYLLLAAQSGHDTWGEQDRMFNRVKAAFSVLCCVGCFVHLLVSVGLLVAACKRKDSSVPLVNTKSREPLRSVSLGLLIYIYTCWLIFGCLVHILIPHAILHFSLPITLLLSVLLRFKPLGHCAQITVAALLLFFSALACGCTAYLSKFYVTIWYDSNDWFFSDEQALVRAATAFIFMCFVGCFAHLLVSIGIVVALCRRQDNGLPVNIESRELDSEGYKRPLLDTAAAAPQTYGGSGLPTTVRFDPHTGNL